MANSVKDSVTTEENPYSFRKSWIFFLHFSCKYAGGFSTHAGIPGYFLPLNMFVLGQDGCLDYC